MLAAEEINAPNNIERRALQTAGISNVEETAADEDRATNRVAAASCNVDDRAEAAAMLGDEER